MSYHRVSPGMYQQGRNGPIVKSLHSPDLRGVGIGAFERNQIQKMPQSINPNSQLAGIGGFEQNQMPNQGINDLVGQMAPPSRWSPQSPQLPNESGYAPQGPQTPPPPPAPQMGGIGQQMQAPQMAPWGQGYHPTPFNIDPDGSSGPGGMNPMQQQLYNSLPWKQAQGQAPKAGQGLANALMGVSPR